MARTRDAQMLADEAARAAELRTLSLNPDVVALEVERVRTQVDRAAWTGIVLGLAFTMVNVQAFAAGSAEDWTLPWLAAWLLDPMVSLVLIALLRAEQVAARWHVETAGWVRAARWFALGATYAMNTWSAWFPNAQGVVPSQVLLHSVPPLLVFFAAEAITDAREALTSAVLAAERGLGPAPQAVVPEPVPEVPEALRSAPEAPEVAGAGSEPAPESAPTRAVAEPAGRLRPRRIAPSVVGGGRPRAVALRPREPQPDTGDEVGERPPERTGRKKADARAYYLHERRHGRTRTPGELNDYVGSDSLVKPSDLAGWDEEFTRSRIGLVGTATG